MTRYSASDSRTACSVRPARSKPPKNPGGSLRVGGRWDAKGQANGTRHWLFPTEAEALRAVAAFD